MRLKDIKLGTVAVVAPRGFSYASGDFLVPNPNGKQTATVSSKHKEVRIKPGTRVVCYYKERVSNYEMSCWTTRWTTEEGVCFEVDTGYHFNNRYGPRMSHRWLKAVK